MIIADSQANHKIRVWNLVRLTLSELYALYCKRKPSGTFRSAQRFYFLFVWNLQQVKKCDENIFFLYQSYGSLFGRPCAIALCLYKIMTHSVYNPTYKWPFWDLQQTNRVTKIFSYPQDFVPKEIWPLPEANTHV